MADNLDITQKIIHFAFSLPGDKSMDLRIAMALLEKIVVFLLFFLIGGEKRFSFFDYGLSLIGWLVMHVHIVLFELRYVKFGENNLERRYYYFKIADFLQMGIVLIYFAVSIHVQDLITPLNSFMLYVTLIDQGMNVSQFVQLGDIRPPQGEEEINFRGGFVLFIAGIFVGSCFSYYIMYRLLTYAQHLQNQYFPFYPAFLWCGLIGEIAFMIYSFVYLTEQTPQLNFANPGPRSWCKYLLCASYGLCIGIFNIYYAIILGIYCVYQIIKYLIELYQSCRGYNRVHPK